MIVWAKELTIVFIHTKNNKIDTLWMLQYKF